MRSIWSRERPLRAATRAMRKDYDLLVDSVSPFCPTFAGLLVRGRPMIADIGLDIYGSAKKCRATSIGPQVLASRTSIGPSWASCLASCSC